MNRRLHVHHLITKLELGGAQQNTLYCVRNHSRDRFKVSLGTGPGGILDGDARGIKDASVHFMPGLVREINPKRDFSFLRRFSRFLKDEKVDILHTHSSKAGILGRFAAAMAKVPIIIHTVHGWGFHERQRYPVRKLYITLERMAAYQSDLLVAVSRENREQGLREGIGSYSQYAIIRSGIDISAFRKASRTAKAVRSELGIPANGLVVGTVGNFKPQKAPLDFVAAAFLVLKSIPNAYFVMVGDGELRGETKLAANRLGIQNRLVFTGWRRDIPDLLHSFNVFALTSIFEGLPRSVLQAQAAGVPVVATAAGGTPEAVSEGITGYITRVGDVEAVASRLIHLLGNPRVARDMGKAGAEMIGEEFEIRKMLRDIEREYCRLAETKRLA